MEMVSILFSSLACVSVDMTMSKSGDAGSKNVIPFQYIAAVSAGALIPDRDRVRLCRVMVHPDRLLKSDKKLLLRSVFLCFVR